MSDENELPSPAPAPEPAPPPRTRTWRGPSLVWLVPILALAVGVSLIVQRVIEKGPRVTIEFNSAEGLRPGRTEVRYKEVVVGRVDRVSLTDDRQRVRVSVQLDRSVSNIAVDDTRFWVVRPRVDTAGISGLETLFSGAYIGVDAGVAKEKRTHFEGLEAPPFVLRGEPGRGFVLRTASLGSLDVGSPILYRSTRVGRVVGYTLDPKTDELNVQVFVEAPYEQLVNKQTRFWNISGVNLNVGVDGLSLNTQTLASVLAGGVAFERPPGTQTLQPAEDGARFDLFNDRKRAMAPPDGQPLAVRMVFDQSVRGLAVGSPIDFLGIEVGTVQAIRLRYDRRRQRYPVEVQAQIYPLRLGEVRDTVVDGVNSEAARDRVLMQRLIESGLRAQARTGSLLTGQMYVALDFIPSVRSVNPGDDEGPVRVPTVPGTLSEVQPQIAEIVAKINKVPFDELGRNLGDTLTQARSAIGKLTPEAQQTLADVNKTLAQVQESLKRVDRSLLDPNAPVQRNVEQTLNDLQRAAQSLRVLTDYLQRHPESLLRGKPDDPVLPSTSGSGR